MDGELEVKLRPEIDEDALNALNEQISKITANLNIGGTAGGTVSAPAGVNGDGVQKVQDDPSEEDELKKAKSWLDALTDRVKGDSTVADTLFKGINSRLTSLVNLFAKTESSEGQSGSKKTNSILTTTFEYLATGVAVIYKALTFLVEKVTSIFTLVRNTAGPLDSVLNMFSTIFDMFFIPLNVALTHIMIPYLQVMAEGMGKWVTTMMDIYEDEGLVGLITNTFEELIEVFAPVILEIMTITVQLFWGMIVGLMKSDWAPYIMAVTIALAGLTAYLVYRKLNAITNTALLTLAVKKLNGIGANIALILSWISAGALAGVAMTENIIGLAEGGVFEPNNPMFAMIGDNPIEKEIVSPYSTMVDAVKEGVSSTNFSESDYSRKITINNTFNINGSNANDVADTVIKQMSKQIGKSHSKW